MSTRVQRSLIDCLRQSNQPTTACRLNEDNWVRDSWKTCASMGMTSLLMSTHAEVISFPDLFATNFSTIFDTECLQPSEQKNVRRSFLRIPSPSRPQRSSLAHDGRRSRSHPAYMAWHCVTSCGVHCLYCLEVTDRLHLSRQANKVTDGVPRTFRTRSRKRRV